MSLPDHVQRWADNPDGGGIFTSDRDAVLAHNSECPSITHAWLPRKGGFSDLCELQECDGDCGVTFYIDGVRSAFDECPESWHWYCACCLAKATTCPCSDPEETP